MTEFTQLAATWIGYCIILAVCVTVIAVFLRFLADRIWVAKAYWKQARTIDRLRTDIKAALEHEGTDHLSHDLASDLRQTYIETDPLPPTGDGGQ